MVKVFALTGIRVGELPLLTAEAVETGWLSVSGEQRPIQVACGGSCWIT